MRDFFSECGTWGIMEGDCLERLQELPEGCADLVLIDPPYGTIKGLDLHNWTAETTAWDDALEAGELMRNCARLLRRNGRAVVFSQEPYSSQLGIRAWDNLAFNYRMIWRKNTFGNGKSAKKAPVSYYEDILVFTQKYDLGVNLHPLRSYYRELAAAAGLDANRAAQLLGNRSAEHAFRFDSSQFANCSQATYSRLVEVAGLDRVEGFLPWEEVARIDAEFKARTAATFHLPEGKGHRGNVLEFPKEAKSYHPTQKPVALLVEILETFTNPGDLVVDFTMGSGSTGVACLKTGRRFVGVEKAQKHFETAQWRISTAWEESGYV